MQRIILHIDFDSFFASVEQQANPLLRGKPVGVTAHNGRTCIIASSREAKQLGIGTASRTYDALKIYPTIALVKADFVKYFEVSKKFLNICKDYSPFVELFSIDELFMDITKTIPLFGSADCIVRMIKQRIKREIGAYITASIGASHNKLLAKLASGFDKPNGFVTIFPDQILDVYKKAKLTDVCGIGNRINSRLQIMGIYSLLQLRKAPLSSLIAEFGNVEGRFLKNVGLGIDPSPVIPYTEAPGVKSVGRQYCLPENEYDKRVILQNVYELCEEIGIKLRRLKKRARTIGVSLYGSRDIHGHKSITTSIDSGKDIFSLCQYIIRQQCNEEHIGYVRRIGVWAGNLADAHTTPLSLFDNEKRRKLVEVVDKINEKFGDHTIRNGFLLYANKLTTVPNGYLADKYERLKLAEQTV